MVDVGTNPSSPSLKGSYTSSTYLDGAWGVAVSPDGKYAYVTGSSSDSLAVVDVGTNPSSPSLKGFYASKTYIDNPQGVAVSPDGKYAYVTGSSSDSLAVVDD